VFGPILCRSIFRDAPDAPERVPGINAAAPNCECEKFSVSEHSPGRVEDAETLTRFVFYRDHLDKTGKYAKPSLFSHACTNGCSIQREVLATPGELSSFVDQFIADKARNPKVSWFGVLTSNCGAVRGLRSPSQPTERAAAVYDTALPNNAAHAEIFKTQHIIPEADELELKRNLLMAVFAGGKLTGAQTYRDGTVWAAVSENTRARPTA
jgi:hypothetical protein